MKKLTAMLLALTLCFGLAACGGNTAQDDTKDESQTVQTGKTEDKKDESKTEEKSDETKTKTKTDDKTSTDSKTEDKTTETKPVTSSTNTTTAKPSGSASTSKPSASTSTSKPAASAPESKPAQSKPAASAPAETKPQNRRSRLLLRRAGTSAHPHPHLRAHSAHRHPRAIRRAAWAKARTASGRMTGLPFIPIRRAVRRLSKRFNKLAVSN
ncbi:hypothetical protein DWV55_10985 [Butyricicoccus sp. AF10-3]|nr:hypothetical protein [Butyricicoccus sp. AF10-3]RHS33029.1 hypothetical protein DWV55_10985 [Butyricicoccus sp. AF10-3]